jgi:hypothetical protein
MELLFFGLISPLFKSNFLIPKPKKAIGCMYPFCIGNIDINILLVTVKLIKGYAAKKNSSMIISLLNQLSSKGGETNESRLV